MIGNHGRESRGEGVGVTMIAGSETQFQISKASIVHLTLSLTKMAVCVTAPEGSCVLEVLVAEDEEERWKKVGAMEPPHTTQSPLVSTATHPTHWPLVD
jgi:23S rRNA U2552 (ribose-2'-O)-methylase RlmE/FtsJ